MLLCNFQQDTTDPTLFVCNVCNKPWKDRHNTGKPCIRECIIVSRTTKLIKFTAALTRFIVKGRGKFLPEEQIWARLEICKQCPSFTGTGCTICGCNCGNKKKFLNKLSYPTEECPDGPPRWLKVI